MMTKQQMVAYIDQSLIFPLASARSVLDRKTDLRRLDEAKLRRLARQLAMNLISVESQWRLHRADLSVDEARARRKAPRKTHP